MEAMEATQTGGVTASIAGGNDGIINTQANNEAASATTSTNDPKRNLKHIINSTEKSLGLLHQLYLTVSSFNSASQSSLLERLNSLVLELDDMEKLSEKCDFQVPIEVLNILDEGKNPDEFTRDVINGCIAKNQITRGKTDSFKSFRKHLLEELEQAFPDEVETYREIHASSAAASFKQRNFNKSGFCICLANSLQLLPTSRMLSGWHKRRVHCPMEI